MIDELAPTKRQKIEGVFLKEMYIEKFGGGSVVNMNKALKNLRRYQKVNFEVSGVRIFYWRRNN